MKIFLRQSLFILLFVFVVSLLAPAAQAGIFDTFLGKTGLPSPLSEELSKELRESGAKAAALSLHINLSVAERLDPRIYAAGLIRSALSLVGILFIALIIYGGALWMLSRGEEEKIKKAKQVLSRSVIGIILILGSYSLAFYIQWALLEGTKDTFEKMQDPRFQSACGTEWQDYQDCLTDVDCSKSKAKQLYKKWQSCIKKPVEGAK